MLVFTGDTHGDEERFSSSALSELVNMGKDDYYIICGDFGYMFASDSPYPSLSETEKTRYLEWVNAEEKFLDGLEKLPFNILFADGNHENFDRLYRIPVGEWHGGKVRFVRKNIIHLTRGQVFDIGGYSVFTFGGGASADKGRRTEKMSWWHQELPTADEYAEGMKNLAAHNNKVDFVVTHTAPNEIVEHLLHYKYISDYKRVEAERELNDYLQHIYDTLDFRAWFCGHFHKELVFDDKLMILYMSNMALS